MTTLKTETTNEQLREGYRIAAEVVALYGDAYLPLFQRLHGEIQKLSDTAELKSIALQIASANVTKDKG